MQPMQWCDILNHGAALRKSEALQNPNAERVCRFPTECVEIIDELRSSTKPVWDVCEKVAREVTLFFKFQGSDDAIQETSRYVESAIAKHGATDYQLAQTSRKRDIAGPENALLRACISSGCKGWMTDVW